MSTLGTPARIPARYHHGDLRAALVQRATAVVATGGVEALSLRELARDLGVSHGAPSRHFPDRQSLLDAVALNGFQLLRAAVSGARRWPAAPSAGALAGPRAAFADELAALAKAYVQFAVQNASLLTVMFAAKHRQEAPADLLAAAEQAFAVPVRVIEQGQAAGEVVALPVEVIATAVLATTHGFAALVAGGLLEPDDSGDVLARTVALLVDGLRPR